MAEITAISWTNHTFNPWSGCVKVSAGCANCYAANLPPAMRRGAEWGKDSPRIPAGEDYWRQPLAWERAAIKAGERRRVFCASTADVFEARDDLDPARARLFALIEATPGLDWLLTTKRADEIMRRVPASWRHRFPRNVWMLVSVEDQRAANERIPHLLKVPAWVRGLSMEPLLGPVDLSPWIGYNPHHDLNIGSGGVRVRRGDAGLSGDSVRRDGLEDRIREGKPMERHDVVSPVRSGADRHESAANIALPDGEGDARGQASERRGTSAGVPALLRAYSSRSDHQSQEWRDHGQPAGEPGARDLQRAGETRYPGTRAETEGSGRHQERHVEADRSSGSRDPASSEGWGAVEVDCGGLRRHGSAGVTDRAGPAVGISWVITGGESGRNARPMEESWVANIHSQARAARVAIHHKQMGAWWAEETGAEHKKGGDPAEWPAALRVREFPEVPRG